MEESGFRIISNFSNTEDSDVAYIEGEKAIYINNNNEQSKDDTMWSKDKRYDEDSKGLIDEKIKGSKSSLTDTEQQTGGFFISVFNLMNAILGSGILGLSYAMSQLGVVLFFVLLTFVACLCLYAIHLLLVLCEQTKVKAYERLGIKALGSFGKYLAATCILLQNIGAMSSYLFIVKYELPNVMKTIIGPNSENLWFTNGNYLVILVTLCVIMPLASLKNIGFLGYTSGFSISCMLFFTGVIVSKKFSIDCPIPVDEDKISYLENSTYINSTSNKWNSTEDWDEHDPIHLYEEFGPQQCTPKTLELSSKWYYSIPTMTFSFVCHTAVLPIYSELKNSSPQRMQRVANTSIFICYLLYALAALFGYLTFYNWMEAEMLLMYSYVDSADLLTMIVRITVLIAVVLTVPLTHFPARKALSFILFKDQSFSWRKHLGVMAILLTTINVLVILVPSIRDVFGIIGATASTMLVFVMPASFFLILDKSSITSKKKLTALGMAILGVGLMIESLTTIISGYF